MTAVGKNGDMTITVDVVGRTTQNGVMTHPGTIHVKLHRPGRLISFALCPEFHQETLLAALSSAFDFAAAPTLDDSGHTPADEAAGVGGPCRATFRIDGHTRLCNLDYGHVGAHLTAEEVQLADAGAELIRAAFNEAVPGDGTPLDKMVAHTLASVPPETLERIKTHATLGTPASTLELEVERLAGLGIRGFRDFDNEPVIHRTDEEARVCLGCAQPWPCGPVRGES